MFFAEHPNRIELELDTFTVGSYPLDGINHEITAVWLRAHFKLFGPSNPNIPPAVCRIDTAAGLSLIPRRIWEPHDTANGIEWLSKEGDGRYITGIGDKRLPTRLGRLEVWLIDVKNRKKMRQWIVAECALDGQDGHPELPDTLIGLGGDAMHEAGLCLNYADRQFWYVRAV